MSAELCFMCGARIAGGQTRCQELYDALVFQAAQEMRIAAVHALAFDTYCMQHVEIYCQSAKSYAAHLMRLCVGVEYDARPVIYTALQHHYNVERQKPEVLRERGSITIAEVQAVADVAAKVMKVSEWASDVWNAYERQHDLARHWVQAALAASEKRLKL